MNGHGPTVSAELGVRLVVPDSTRIPLRASLRYTATDPYAVRVAFHTGIDEEVEWIFARELLTVGVVCHSGEGDVRVWPAHGEDGDEINIALSSPSGNALFEVPLPQLAEFLQRTYCVVPAGDETRFVNVDGELEHVLRRSRDS